MKEKNSNYLSKLIILLGLILCLLFLKTNKLNLRNISLLSVGDRSVGGGKLISSKNKEIPFETTYLKPYININLRTSKSENIEDGLKFEIVNDKGEIIDRGRLYDGKEFIESYKYFSLKGKIVFYFDDENQSSKLNYGYSITSVSEK